MIDLDVDCLYVNGDSWAYGSELRDLTRSDITNDFDPVHDTYRQQHNWAGLLGKRLGLPVVNNGWAGGSNQRIMRTTLSDITNLKREGRKPLAVIAWTQMQRFELYDANACRWSEFVSPTAGNVPKIGLEIWEKYSSDRSDVHMYLQQLVYMDAFLKTNQVTYLGTNVFRHNWNILEDYSKDPEFAPHLYHLSKTIKMSEHLFNVSISQVLTPHLDVIYGAGGHPLERGQEIIAEHLHSKIKQHYQFKTTQA